MILTLIQILQIQFLALASVVGDFLVCLMCRQYEVLLYADGERYQEELAVLRAGVVPLINFYSFFCVRLCKSANEC